jgi:hypothetical protein
MSTRVDGFLAERRPARSLAELEYRLACIEAGAKGAEPPPPPWAHELAVPTAESSFEEKAKKPRQPRANPEPRPGGKFNRVSAVKRVSASQLRPSSGLREVAPQALNLDVARTTREKEEMTVEPLSGDKPKLTRPIPVAAKTRGSAPIALRADKDRAIDRLLDVAGFPFSDPLYKSLRYQVFDVYAQFPESSSGPSDPVAQYNLGRIFQINSSAVTVAKKIGGAVEALLNSATRDQLSATAKAVEQLIRLQTAAKGDATV